MAKRSLRPKACHHNEWKKNVRGREMAVSRYRKEKEESAIPKGRSLDFFFSFLVSGLWPPIGWRKERTFGVADSIVHDGHTVLSLHPMVGLLFTNAFLFYLHSWAQRLLMNESMPGSVITSLLQSTAGPEGDDIVHHEHAFDRKGTIKLMMKTIICLLDQQVLIAKRERRWWKTDPCPGMHPPVTINCV